MISDHEILERVPESLRSLLRETNGFVLFEGGLHVRGAVLSPPWHSLRHVWLGDFPLHKLFPALRESDIPFGQDCLGDQFVLRKNLVHKLEAESGELESLEMNLESFLALARENPLEFLSLHPLVQFRQEGGDLKPGQLLNVYPPFITKESEGGVSLKAVPMFERINFLADFSRQITS
jgi:hypothetical protein